MATLHFICGKAGAGKTTLRFEIRSLENFTRASSK